MDGKNNSGVTTFNSHSIVSENTQITQKYFFKKGVILGCVFQQDRNYFKSS